ncbi:MAG: hypothetical protein RLZZ69_1423 [Cyanobacteriota bacterium]|jgi:hypothetical protein
MENLSESIQAIADASFQCCGDYRTDVIFDPTKGIVYTSLNTGGQPLELYFGRHFRITQVYKTVIGQSLCSALLEIQDLLEQLAEEFLGADERGNGLWTEKGENIQATIKETIDQIELGHYWSPEDWFQYSIDDLKSQWKDGATSEQILAGENLGNSLDGECDRGTAIAWLDELIEEWESEDLKRLEESVTPR